MSDDEEDLSSEEENGPEKDNSRDFDLRYSGEAAFSNSANSALAEPATAGRFSGFDSAWLKAKVNEYFENNETALNLGIDELTSTVYDVLNSQRRDDELQNEVS